MNIYWSLSRCVFPYISMICMHIHTFTDVRWIHVCIHVNTCTDWFVLTKLLNLLLILNALTESMIAQMRMLAVCMAAHDRLGRDSAIATVSCIICFQFQSWSDALKLIWKQIIWSDIFKIQIPMDMIRDHIFRLIEIVVPHFNCKNLWVPFHRSQCACCCVLRGSRAMIDAWWFAHNLIHYSCFSLLPPFQARGATTCRIYAHWHHLRHRKSRLARTANNYTQKFAYHWS